MDLSSRATPDSASTVGSSSQGFSSQLLGSQNPMDKVDSIMFSSDDPFAYPNQPMMELGFKADGGQMAMGNQGPDARYFMNPTGLDDMNQILGQPPPYMMQPHQNQAMQMNPAMYDPHLMMSMHPGGPQAQQVAPQPQPQHTVMAHRRAQAMRNQERIDQMFTNQGMQPDWGSFFGSGRGGFQGL